jgi:hypothetical protein
MQDEFKNAPRTGRLFAENQVQCVRKGTISTPCEPYTNDEGELVTDEDRYYSILLYTKRNAKGDVEYQKYELCLSVGRLYINDKKNENSPDIDGPVTIDGQKFKFCGWKKTASNDKEFTKVTLYEKEDVEPTGELENSDAPFPQDTITDEDIPF